MPARVFSLLRSLTNRKGVTALEYAIIAGSIFIAVASVVGTLAANVRAIYSSLTNIV
jgi:Flp pilus assembly pilin Flp